jgi:zinc transport system substrate-binding protein
MSIHVIRTVAAAMVIALAAGCGRDEGSSTDDGTIDVVASFAPVAEAVEVVGGDRVSVTNLTPPGAEPHDLELTPGQVDRLDDADAVFVLGHGFQPAVEEAAKQRNDATVELLDEIETDDTDDPHVWLDPSLHAQLVDAVARELTRADADGASAYDRNAAMFSERIDAVDRAYREGLDDCERRTIVTAHDAFGHLARRYGLEQQGIAGISPDDEPSAARIAELADLVEREGVTTIFTEELVSPRVADALAREAGGIQTEVLDPIEGLPDDIAAGDGWISAMETNLEKLRTALGCA